MSFNLGNSIFAGLNSERGIMICGYEFGLNKEDQRIAESGETQFCDPGAVTTFSNKSPMHGDRAFGWVYDNRIIKWFALWGHPLSREGLGGDFEKCILQTNWCDTEGNRIEEDYFSKLTSEDQINNFIFHVAEFEPMLLFFMGSEMINILQDARVLPRFVEVVGQATSAPYELSRPFAGRPFKVRLQEFEKCKVVSLPHPSGSWGLSDDYIALFKDDIGPLIDEVKLEKGISSSV